ncbi:MAG: hypothetical protein R2800_01140 [Flavipsychrobacter sp.]
MEQLFEEARYVIRYEKGNFNSGYCIIEDRKVAVINKFLSVEGRINVLVEILPTIEVTKEELSGEMLKWYEDLMKGIEKKANDDSAEQSKIDL